MTLAPHECKRNKPNVHVTLFFPFIHFRAFHIKLLAAIFRVLIYDYSLPGHILLLSATMSYVLLSPDNLCNFLLSTVDP